MQLKDITIRTQIRIGMGVILLLVLLLGAVAWLQTDLLWQESEGLYNHPLKVRRTIGEIKADILAMHGYMKDLILLKSEKERQPILQEMDACEADAQRQFPILSDAYLGPRRDVDEAFNYFVGWKALREEAIRLLRAGQAEKAAAYARASGPGGIHVNALLGHIREVSNYAEGRADKFFLDATRRNDTLKLQLGCAVGFIFLLALTIAYFLLQGIEGPLRELTAAADQYQHGDLAARSRYRSANEFGRLSASFNLLAETVQTDLQIRQDTVRIAETLLREEELHAFCQELLRELLLHTGSQAGAVYLLNEQKTAFAHFASIGLTGAGRASFAAAEREGEFGLALATGQIQRITNIPADTPLTFATVNGDCAPREMITIPILAGQEAIAVVCLTSLRDYSAAAVRLVNDLRNVLVARLNGVLAFAQIREFSRRLELQNQELQLQQEELGAQAEELRKQTEELQEQNVELERQQMALKEAGRLKSEFLSNMSHELRTPLNSVMALSRVLLMQAGEKLNAEERNYLEIIARNGKNLLTLINDILDLSKIEAGRMDVNPRSFSLGQTIENILESIAPLAREKNIDLKQQIPEDLPLLASDEIRVAQILQNLLANAVKFTDRGGVTVTARSHQEQMIVTVEDTGIGIGNDDLPHIFDEFRQVDGSTSRRYEGTGLGLAIARKAARMLDGGIAVESTPGVGSRFTLRLPIRWQGAAPAPDPLLARRPLEVQSKRKTILVVDDEPEQAAMISRSLLREGYNTLTALSGTEALRLADREHPFAVVLDISMPDMDGWEVLQGLKKNPGTQDIPVVILSIPEDRATGFALGAVGFVATPLSKKLLIAEIKRIGRPETRILLVEDNEAAIIQLQAILEHAGYRVDAARGGQEALASVSRAIPDGVILDLMMPEIDGFAVLENIRGTEATAHLPVLILTAKDLLPEDFRRLSANNVQQLVQKGDIDQDRLLAMIESLLGTASEPRREAPPGVASANLLSSLPASDASGAAPGAPTILVVEDNPDNMTTIKAVLQNRCPILEAADGAEGLRLAAEALPDLILLDMALPKMDGYAVARHLKDDSELRHIPVIAMTAHAMKGDREKILAAGCDDYISKPIDPEGFLKKIEEYVNVQDTGD